MNRFVNPTGVLNMRLSLLEATKGVIRSVWCDRRTLLQQQCSRIERAEIKLLRSGHCMAIKETNK
jgi:hypothetical protein